MRTFEIKDGIKVQIASNGALLFVKGELNHIGQIVKPLTISESLAMAQALIQSAMIELGPIDAVFELKKPD